jgi:cytoskeleton protein RodZ
METFGSYLKTHREKKGIRLEEIASITKIHLHSLELLETGRWAQLPPEPFIRGFIIAYAKYVGLDPKQAISRYLEEVTPSTSVDAPVAVPGVPATHIPAPAPVKAERAPTPKAAAPSKKVSPEPEKKTVKTPPPPPVAPSEREQESGFSTRMGMGAVAVGLALTLAIFVIMKRMPHDETSAPESIAAVAPTEAPSPSVAPAPPLANAENPAPPINTIPGPVVLSTSPQMDNRTPASPEKTSESRPKPVAAAQDAKHEVVIEGKERSWVKIVIDDKPPLEFFLKEGQKVKYKANDKIKVVLGNSAGTTVSHNGEPTPGVKFQGTIRSYIFPADARFPQDVPKKTPPPPDDSDTETTQEQPDQG